VVQNFCVVDLSTFYLDIAKDRLYISDTKAFRRRSCQTVLALALENLTKAIAPVLSYLAEDIWQYLPYTSPYPSVFESGWVVVKPEWNKPELISKWTKIRQIRTEVNKVMENARTQKVIGSSLDAKVLLYLADADFKQELDPFNLGDSFSGNLVDELRYFFLASQVELVDSKASIETANYTGESELVSVGIVKADGQKCDRCWNYSTHVGEFKEDPTICERCNSALKGEF
jgi:isoleucyl-tRNA synthetase